MEVIRLKLRWVYVGGILAVTTLCGVLWSIQSGKEKGQEQEQVTQLEGQIGIQYIHANYLLKSTVESLLEWDFSQPLTDADERYLRNHFNNFSNLRGIIFNGYIVHEEWRRRMYDIEGYLLKYGYDRSLSKEEVDDLYQGLEATRFISLDLDDMLDSFQDFYDGMHDEQHEMRERIKSRLATQY